MLRDAKKLLTEQCDKSFCDLISMLFIRLSFSQRKIRFKGCAEGEKIILKTPRRNLNEFATSRKRDS